jgi:hypothetical protein
VKTSFWTSDRSRAKRNIFHSAHQRISQFILSRLEGLGWIRNLCWAPSQIQHGVVASVRGLSFWRLGESLKRIHRDGLKVFWGGYQRQFVLFCWKHIRKRVYAYTTGKNVVMALIQRV